MTTLTYDSYQKAKLQNNLPGLEIYQLENNGRFFSANVDMDKIYVHEFLSDATKCNPADHCMSLHDFLKNGNKLVDGDSYIFNKEVIVVGDKISAELLNRGRASDDIRFVLSAKALDEKEPEQVEWNNGDECVYMVNPEGKGAQCDAVFIGYHPNHPVVVIDNGHSIFATSLDNIKKKETPEQKKERELIEAAYDLYLCWMGDDEPASFDKFKTDKDWADDWSRLAIKTGYRKPE